MKNPFGAVFDFFLDCHHRELTRVFTLKGRTYRVCCQCGAEFEYSLEDMRLVSRRRMHRHARFVDAVGNAAASEPGQEQEALAA